jgi:hypothetical protein
MAAGLTTAGCGKSDWRDFNSAEGKYSVQFPGKPEDKSVTYHQGPKVHAQVVIHNQATFLVSFIDLPPEIPLDYAAILEGMTGQVGGKVIKLRDWTIDGYKGKEVEMSITSTPFYPVSWVASAANKGKRLEWWFNRNRAGFASMRMVVINNRLYQIVAIGEETDFENADVKKFFDSFKLTQ